MQLSNHALLGLRVVHVEVEPLIKLLRVTEDVGKEEVEEGPELVEVVLEGRAGEQEARGGADTANRLRDEGAVVLDPL